MPAGAAAAAGLSDELRVQELSVEQLLALCHAIMKSEAGQN